MESQVSEDCSITERSMMFAKSSKKPGHLVRSTMKTQPTTPKEAAVMKESVEDIPQNIKPMRVCVKEFIYCAGKRMKYIPMGKNNLLSPTSNMSDKQISTQHTLSTPVEENKLKGWKRKISLLDIWNYDIYDSSSYSIHSIFCIKILLF